MSHAYEEIMAPNLYFDRAHVVGYFEVSMPSVKAGLVIFAS